MISSAIKSKIRSIFTISRNKLESYVFYKIIDQDLKTETYRLICINTNGTFKCSLDELIKDKTILFGLHPLQSCLIGIEHGKYLKGKGFSFEFSKEFAKKKAGQYQLLYLDREGKVAFVDLKTNDRHILEPIEIVDDPPTISKFNACQAYYIGVLAAFNNLNKLQTDLKKRSHLKLIKSI